MITENLSTLKINKLKSAEQFNNAEAAGKINDNEIYLVPDVEDNLENGTGDSALKQKTARMASSRAATALGINTQAKGQASLAAGSYTNALHDMSFAVGTQLSTGTAYQTVVGVENAITADALFVVGNGTRASGSVPEVRSNALEALKDGRVKIGADPINDNDVATKRYVDTKLSEAGGDTSYLEYKTILFKDFETEGTSWQQGYIKITIPNISLIELVIDDNIWAEHDAPYYQLYCGRDAHQHRLFFGDKIFVDKYPSMYSTCSWYIPFYASQTVTVAARDLLYGKIDQVTAEWISASQVPTDDIEEIKSYYATRQEFDALKQNSIPTPTSADEGKILKVVNGKPSWVALPNAEEVKF